MSDLAGLTEADNRRLKGRCGCCERVGGSGTGSWTCLATHAGDESDTKSLWIHLSVWMSEENLDQLILSTQGDDQRPGWLGLTLATVLDLDTQNFPILVVVPEGSSVWQSPCDLTSVIELLGHPDMHWEGLVCAKGPYSGGGIWTPVGGDTGEIFPRRETDGLVDRQN